MAFGIGALVVVLFASNRSERRRHTIELGINPQFDTLCTPPGSQWRSLRPKAH
jgi:hypothetical protein